MPGNVEPASIEHVDCCHSIALFSGLKLAKDVFSWIIIIYAGLNYFIGSFIGHVILWIIITSLGLTISGFLLVVIYKFYLFLTSEADAPSVSVVPQPGICVKTKNVSGNNFYINLCKLSEIPTPPPIEETELTRLMEGEDTDLWRVPMSIGRPRREADMSGGQCWAAEVAVNSAWFDKMVSSDLFIRFVVMNAIVREGLCDKFGWNARLGWDKWTVMKNKKFMGDPAKCPALKVPSKLNEDLLEEQLLESKRKCLNEKSKRIHAEKKQKEHEKTMKEVKKLLQKSEADKRSSQEVLLQKLERMRERLNQKDDELKNYIEEKVLLREIDKMQERLNQKEDELKNFKRSCVEKRIQEIEDSLECPICLETASVPIYTCLQFHLICSKCRPQVAKCPECRESYKDQRNFRRHRYAERDAEELRKLKESS